MDRASPCPSPMSMVPGGRLAPSDAELIALTRSGDTDAWAQLYERHSTAAERVAIRLAGHADAPDLVSDAFMRTWATIKRGNGPQYAFRPYILSAVKNLYVNHVRSDSRYVLTTDDQLGTMSAPLVDVGEELVESTVLAAAFRTLPDRWRAVLWHTIVEDESAETLADRLGISRNTLAALAYRA